jgi:hypothetical protein
MLAQHAAAADDAKDVDKLEAFLTYRTVLRPAVSDQAGVAPPRVALTLSATSARIWRPWMT